MEDNFQNKTSKLSFKSIIIIFVLIFFIILIFLYFIYKNKVYQESDKIQSKITNEEQNQIQDQIPYQLKDQITSELQDQIADQLQDQIPDQLQVQTLGQFTTPKLDKDVIKPTGLEIKLTKPVRFIKIINNDDGNIDYLHISQIVVKNAQGINILRERYNLISDSGMLNTRSYQNTNSILIDGIEGIKSYPNIYHSSKGGENTFVQIDLGDDLGSLFEVTIYNRGDCCQEKLASYLLELYDANNQLLSTKELNSLPEQTYKFMAPQLDEQITNIPKPIKFVKIVNNGDGNNNVLHISQLVMKNDQGINIIKNNYLLISSSGTLNKSDPDILVDGFEGFRDISSIYHSSTGGANTFVQIDLGEVNGFFAISIYNRKDCCQEKLASYLLQLYDDNNQLLYTKNLKSFLLQTYKFEALKLPEQEQITQKFPRPTKFFKIINNGDGNNNVLQISQIVVKNDKGINILRGNHDWISGTPGSYVIGTNSGVPFYSLVDGYEAVKNYSTNYSKDVRSDNAGIYLSTTGGANTYLKVDLGELDGFFSITIYNRKDCCQVKLMSYLLQLYDVNDQLLSTIKLKPSLEQTYKFESPKFPESILNFLPKPVKFVKIVNNGDGNNNVLGLSQIIINDFQNKNILQTGQIDSQHNIVTLSPGSNKLSYLSGYDANSLLSGYSYISNTGNKDTFVQIELENELYSNFTIIINNLKNCCQENLASYLLQLYDSLNNLLFSIPLTAKLSQTYKFNATFLPPLRLIRYVKISKLNNDFTNEPLYISQVVVNNIKNKNIAKLKKVNGSIYSPNNRVTDGSYFPRDLPLIYQGDFVEIDLEEDQIGPLAITIYNRKDCCQEIMLYYKLELLDSNKQLLISKNLQSYLIQSLKYSLINYSTPFIDGPTFLSQIESPLTFPSLSEELPYGIRYIKISRQPRNGSEMILKNLSLSQIAIFDNEDNNITKDIIITGSDLNKPFNLNAGTTLERLIDGIYQTRDLPFSILTESNLYDIFVLLDLLELKSAPLAITIYNNNQNQGLEYFKIELLDGNKKLVVDKNLVGTSIQGFKYLIENNKPKLDGPLLVNPDEPLKVETDASIISSTAFTYDKKIRYIKIVNIIDGSNNYLNVSQISVLNNFGQNISKNKKVIGSGTLNNIFTKNPTDPQILVDGKESNRDYPDIYFSSTAGKNTFVSIDLEDSLSGTIIVKIYNRNDCCQKRLENFELQLLNSFNAVIFKKSLTSALFQSYVFY